MYRVTVKTNEMEYPLHEPRDDSGALQLIDPILKEEVGKNQTFTFIISPLHPNKDKIMPMSSEIFIYKDNVKITCCRMVSSESDLYNTGKVTCEGELAYLIDSIQRPYEYTGSLYNYFAQLLNTHNSEVEERKRFAIGNVTIAGTEITRSNSEYSNTMTEMISQLTEINGGYLRVRYSGDTKYLDYVSDYGGINAQVIRFGENLLDLTKSIDPTKLITALVPTGATITSEGTDTEDTVVDIKSVNGGVDYIYDADAVAAYGWLWGAQTFEDVTDPEVLLAKARAYLDNAVSIPETIELSAVDLNTIGANADSLNLGYWTDIISKPHGLNNRFLLSRKITGLANPAKNSIVLGKVIPKFAAQAAKEKAQITARVNAVASNASKEINRKVENATQLITGGKGGYVVLDVDDPNTGKRTLPWRILIMDTPDKDTATSVIQINKNGIGFSTTGISGPYRNAWTIDGNLVADFITTGSMFADRIKGGTLELGGTGAAKDGSIVVKDAAGAQIGYWDKTGLHVLKGVISGSQISGSIFTGGAIDAGVLRADASGAQLGDYTVSANGTNVLESANGWFQVDTKDNTPGGPAGDYATLLVKGENWNGVLIEGYGKVTCTTFKGRDFEFTHEYAEGMSAIEMLKQIYGRLDQLRTFVGMGSWNN